MPNAISCFLLLSSFSALTIPAGSFTPLAALAALGLVLGVGLAGNETRLLCRVIRTGRGNRNSAQRP